MDRVWGVWHLPLEGRKNAKPEEQVSPSSHFKWSVPYHWQTFACKQAACVFWWTWGTLLVVVTAIYRSGSIPSNQNFRNILSYIASSRPALDHSPYQRQPFSFVLECLVDYITIPDAWAESSWSCDYIWGWHGALPDLSRCLFILGLGSWIPPCSTSFLLHRS